MSGKRLDLAGDRSAVEQNGNYQKIIQYNVPVYPATNPPTFIGVDLTGYSVKSQVRAEPGQTIVIELDDYITLNADDVLGAMSINIPSSVTAEYTPALLKYDLFLTPPAGEPFKLLWGMFEIRASVTQP